MASHRELVCELKRLVPELSSYTILPEFSIRFLWDARTRDTTSGKREGLDDSSLPSRFPIRQLERRRNRAVAYVPDNVERSDTAGAGRPGGTCGIDLTRDGMVVWPHMVRPVVSRNFPAT